MKNSYNVLLTVIIIFSMTQATEYTQKDLLPIIGYRMLINQSTWKDAIKGDLFEYKGPIKLWNRSSQTIYMVCSLKEKGYLKTERTTLVHHWMPNSFIDHDPYSTVSQRTLAKIFNTYDPQERKSYFKPSNDIVITLAPEQKYQFRAGAFFDEKGYIKGYPTLGITNNKKAFKDYDLSKKHNKIKELPIITFNRITGTRIKDISEFIIIEDGQSGNIHVVLGGDYYLKKMIKYENVE